ncbi:hypothetical protein BGZ76_006726 [Entomortierella beljakovae]|nr:hypothetical protein BGZ76_006726 [Entomortierella beljakovae]
MELLSRYATKFNNQFYIGEHPGSVDALELKARISHMKDLWKAAHATFVQRHTLHPDHEYIVELLIVCPYYYTWIDHGMRHLVDDPADKVPPYDLYEGPNDAQFVGQAQFAGQLSMIYGVFDYGI